MNCVKKLFTKMFCKPQKGDEYDTPKSNCLAISYVPHTPKFKRKRFLIPNNTMIEHPYGEIGNETNKKINPLYRKAPIKIEPWMMEESLGHLDDDSDPELNEEQYNTTTSIIPSSD